MNRFHILTEILECNKNRKFEYGVWDCCTFAADVYEGLTGDDVFWEFRGKYKDKRTYKTLITKMGCKNLLEATVQLLGSPIPKALAWRGDIVYYGGNIGVCYGTSAVFLGEEGYVHVPMKKIKYVFGVGHG